jgi:hypothetical protein
VQSAKKSLDVMASYSPHKSLVLLLPLDPLSPAILYALPNFGAGKPLLVPEATVETVPERFEALCAHLQVPSLPLANLQFSALRTALILRELKTVAALEAIKLGVT